VCIIITHCQHEIYVKTNPKNTFEKLFRVRIQPSCLFDASTTFSKTKQIIIIIQYLYINKRTCIAADLSFDYGISAAFLHTDCGYPSQTSDSSSSTQNNIQMKDHPAANFCREKTQISNHLKNKDGERKDCARSKLLLCPGGNFVLESSSSNFVFESRNEKYYVNQILLNISISTKI